MLDSLRTTLYASLGAVSLAQEKLKETIDELVQKGDLTREQGAKVVESLAEKGEEGGRDLGERVGDEIGRLISKTPLASRRDVEDLQRRVAAIEEHLGLAAMASSTPGLIEGDEEGLVKGSEGY